MNYQYPKYLSSKPSGIDLYDGQSQEHLALAIKEHIEEIDMTTGVDESPVIPRIIGLEGSWGCGKSNVIKKMDDMMNDKYIFFTYDAWGNQEDLQRRSVLERLTERLINDSAIKKETRIKVLREIDDKKFCVDHIDCTWQERLETLCARKSQTRNFTTPEINEDSKVFVLLLLITGMIPAIVEALKFAVKGYEWLDFVFSAISLLSIIGIWFYFFCVRLKKENVKYFCSRPDKRKLSKMWKFYQSNSSSETTSYTISQVEPTEREFTEWMQDLNDSLISKRLVVVFDNMDRLPADKVKQLWSSIHTFFAEKGYSKVWCIVPYDKKHLANAYGKVEENEDNKAIDLCKAFVEKTFPIVYKVPEAVITDYRGVFEKYAKQAFYDLITNEDLDFINRVYRSVNTKPNARHIISFLNELVTLYKRWRNNIEIRNMVLYVINKDSITNNTLIDGHYIGTLDKYYDDNNKTKTQISALYYGVDLTIAAQLPLKIFLQKNLGSKAIDFDINQIVASNYNFFVILDEEIHEMDCKEKLLTTVKILSQITTTDTLLEKDWNYLAVQYTNDDSYPLQARNEFKELVLHSTKDNANRLLSIYLDRVKGESENLKGRELYSYYKYIKDLIDTNPLDITCETPDTPISADHFVEYITEAKEEYSLFPVYCNIADLTKYVNDQIDNNNDISKVLSYLLDDKKYPFDNIHSHTIEKIKATETSIERYEVLFNYCRLTKGENLIEIDASADNHLNNIWANMSSNPTNYECFAEIYLLLALHGLNLNQPDDNTFEKIGKRIWDYVTVDDLFKDMLKYGTGSMNLIVRHCITNKITQNALSDNIISNLESIRQHTGNSYKEILEYIDACGYRSLGATDKSIVCNESVLNRDWVTALQEVNNSFCRLLLNGLKIQIEKQAIDQFCQNNLINQNSYWVIVLDKLINLGYYNKSNVPDIVKAIAENILLSISEGSLGLITADSREDRIMKLVTYEKISSKIYEILTAFTSGRQVMNALKFKALHSWFERMSDINAGGFLNSIINPIKTDADCQNIIASNSTFYKSMINDHISEDSDLHTYLQKIKKGEENTTEQFKDFVELLSNVVVEKKE